ncbi:formimidoylglutamate deiminase [Nocardioides daejeonensis]|uniref:formimidoylglutamate deiminase n=1 Tax=Nocardioides daejeonensis TaxID=1046556 RepID=UPI000D745FB1|nr:formimidoylglutamate deiminase [Nocardioides daejeonensis]
MSRATRLRLERAFIDGVVRDDVTVEIADGRFSAVGVDPAADAERVEGLAVPGFANCHSHVFHRALRGRTQTGGGTFWTWREQMYAVAQRLDPDTLHALATATFREMLAAGYTSVGEFHYLHHAPSGARYTEANVMGTALLTAAAEVGIRITLLDTCYLAAGIGRDPEGVQRRFSDGDAQTWAERVAELDALDGRARIGAAIHSVRAVPREQLSIVVAAARNRPLHVHLSEQVAENEQCLAAHGMTPTALLHDAGALTPLTSAVHATHLTETDIALLGSSGTHACFCPTTERDLGDGVGPSRALHAAGSSLTLGSDSHAVIDPFEEMRAVELDERLVSMTRGHWSATELLDAGGRIGQASLGYADAGRIAVGQRADLVVLDLGSPRTAGTGAGAETAVFAASAADVREVWADGVRHDAGVLREQAGLELARVIGGLWG